MDLGPRLLNETRLLPRQHLVTLVATVATGAVVTLCGGACLAGVGTGRVDDWMLLVGIAAVVAAGILVFAAVLTVAVRHLAGERERVLVYQRGVEWRLGQERRVFPWSRVVAYRRSPDRVQFRAVRESPLRCVLIRDDQSSITLEDLPRLPEIVAEIEKLTALTWIPHRSAALARGESIPFGEIVLEQGGIRGFGAPVPWSEVVALRVDAGGRLNLHTHMGVLEGPEFASVDNPHVLYALVERRAGS